MRSMTKLYLIRHGETMWNVERRMQGHLDSPLSTLGEQPTQGESYTDLQARVIPAIVQLIEEHAGKTIALISHTVTLKMIMAYFERRALADLWNPPYFHPTCLSLVEIIDNEPHIRLHGDTSHFQEEAFGF